MEAQFLSGRERGISGVCARIGAVDSAQVGHIIERAADFEPRYGSVQRGADIKVRLVFLSRAAETFDEACIHR